MARWKKPGIALIIILQLLIVFLILSIAFIMTSNTNLFQITRDKKSLQAFYIAEAALEKKMMDLCDAFSLALSKNPSDPYTELNYYHDKSESEVKFSNASGEEIGNFDTHITISPQPASAYLTDSEGFFRTYKEMTIETTGRIGKKGSIIGCMERKISRVIRIGIRPCEAFNYVYFQNNWGWWWGPPFQDKLVFEGNMGANGYLDVISLSSLIPAYLTSNGNPFYKPSGQVENTAALYAGVEVREVNGAEIQGKTAKNRQDAYHFVPMPNLTDLDAYRSLAKSKGGKITQKSTVIVDAVYTGSSAAERNLVLDGTSSPITISGPVVIDGNLVIKGKVTGQGTIYVGKNLYVAGNLTYGNPPASRPVYDGKDPAAYQQTLDTWVKNNNGADCATFCVRKNVVFGDVTKTLFGRNLWWNPFLLPGVKDFLEQEVTVKDPETGKEETERINDGHEDAGTDGMWATKFSSRDTHENDGKWTVQCRNTSTGEIKTMELLLSGGKEQVPSGWEVIPGTGEDVDGDGHYTAPLQFKDFDFADIDGKPIKFDASYFGNYPEGVKKYENFVNQPANIQAFIYANGAMAGPRGTPGNDYKEFGGEAGRIDATSIRLSPLDKRIFTHDDRISSMSGLANSLDLPGIPAIQRREWKEN